jgi:peptidoglycan hydrolase-like protein with peptidoglycan-binding domain
MKKLIISGVFCSVLMLGGFQVASAEETTTTTSTSNTEMLAKIQDLMKLIADLQAKLTAARGEISELMSDLKVGATGDDVLKAQELLASDPTIFGVKPTGYFGPLTEAAIKKFQEQYGLPVTGVLDEATREVMKELRKERKDGHVPPGFIKSAEMHDKIKARLQAKWGDCIWGDKFRASDCKKGHGDKGEDGDEDDDDDNASSTDATRADAVAAIEEANDVISDFMEDIDQMEEDDVDEDEIEDAEDTLADAKKELADARRSLVKGEFDDAVEQAEDAIEEINGDEDEDEDDEDEDEDDDEDEDEDDEDDEEDDD